MGFFSKMFGKNVQKGKAELAPATMPLERWPTPSCSLLRGAVGCALLKTDLLDFSMLSTTKF